jgi:TonB family protein
MVCRAATGNLAPDLGIPLNTRDGLSGACLQTRQPQLSVDTEFDPRVDPAISRRRGIRSILIVPVFDMNNALFTGVLEVFSTSPAAFSNTDQKLLEGFAEECARIRQAAIELSQRRPAATAASPELIPPELIAPEFTPPEFVAASPRPARRSPSEAWTLVLGSLAILAIIAVSFLIGSRVGWLRSAASQAQATNPIPSETSVLRAQAESCVGTAAGCPAEQSSAAPAAALSGKASGKAATRTSPAADELVVYEKGKVIFRMKPAPAKRQAKVDSTMPDGDSVVEASSTSRIATAKLATTKTSTTKTATTKIAPAQSVWLSPAHAETRLLRRTEPQYPPAALASHRAGNVVLEVQVAEDGSVSSIRTLSGDPLLAAAASEAVRNWRYQPYRQHDQPAQFQTDVTLSFSLPN